MTVNVKLNVDAARLLDGRTGEVGRVMAGFAGVVTRVVRQVADERVHVRTGRYRSGITSTWDGRRILTTATAPYSAILEGGSRPHVIRPRNPDGFLRFTGRDGTVVYAKRVQHPGTRPYRILSDGVIRAGREHFGR